MRELRREVGRRWDLNTLHADVVDSQARRRLVDAALRTGRVAAWEFTPPADGTQQYMRNHLDLNDVERSTRYPPYDPSLGQPRQMPR